MVITGNIHSINPDRYFKTFAIVRSMTYNPAPSRIIQMPELAPSSDLFFTYRKLVRDGNWNSRTYNEIYVPRFIHDIETNPRALKLLDSIARTSNNGKDIALVCFCGDPGLCHRSIVAKMLRDRGADVTAG